jgi:hypothetical protein
MHKERKRKELERKLKALRKQAKRRAVDRRESATVWLVDLARMERLSINNGKCSALTEPSEVKIGAAWGRSI